MNLYTRYKGKFEKGEKTKTLKEVGIGFKNFETASVPTQKKNLLLNQTS